MQSKNGVLLQHLRKARGITQEEMATKLHISQRRLSRIETGDLELDMMQSIVAFEVLGFPVKDLWMTHLDVEEFEGYLQYRKILKFLSDGKVDGIRDVLPLLKENPLAKEPLVGQFTRFASLLIDETMDANEKLKGYYAALEQTITNFEDTKIHEYRLSFKEILIINEIALLHHQLERKDKAIALLKGMAENIEASRTTTADKYIFFTKLLTDLYTLMMEAGDYRNASKVCDQILNLDHARLNPRFIPGANYALGVCYQKMNKSKEEYFPFLVRAYYTARAIAQHDLANKIKKEYDGDEHSKWNFD